MISVLLRSFFEQPVYKDGYNQELGLEIYDNTALPSRQTGDAKSLWRAAIQRGGSVARARGLTVPALQDDDTVIMPKRCSRLKSLKGSGVDYFEPS